MEQIADLAALPEEQLSEKYRKVDNEVSNAQRRKQMTEHALYKVIEKRIWEEHPTWKRESAITQGKVRRMVWEALYRIRSK